MRSPRGSAKPGASSKAAVRLPWSGRKQNRPVKLTASFGTAYPSDLCGHAFDPDLQVDVVADDQRRATLNTEALTRKVLDNSAISLGICADEGCLHRQRSAFWPRLFMQLVARFHTCSFLVAVRTKIQISGEVLVVKCLCRQFFHQRDRAGRDFIHQFSRHLKRAIRIIRRRSFSGAMIETRS